MISVLYVDDEPQFCDILKLNLEKNSLFKVDTSGSVKDGLYKLENKKYDAVVSDYQMPLMDGIEFLKIVRQKYPHLPFIIFTGRGRETVAIDALNNGADYYLQKGREGKAIFAELENMIEKAVDQRRIKDALLISEERYRNVVQTQTEFISRFLPDGTHIFVNDAYCNYFRKKPEEMIGSRFIPEVPEDDLTGIHLHFKSLTLENPVATIVHRITMPNGEIRWQDWNDRAIFNEDGEIIEYQSVGRDITERIEMETALQNSEQFNRGIIDHMPDAMFVVSDKGKVIVWNRVMEEITGMPASKMIGKDDYNYSIPFYGERRPMLVDLVFHDDNEIRKKYDYIQRDKETFVAETHSALPQGKHRVIWGKASPLYNRDGDIIGAIETIRDITDRKNLEYELRQANERIKLMNSVTRHDILNNLTALKAYLELADESLTDPDDLSKFIKKMQLITDTITEQIVFTRDYQDLGVTSPEWHDVYQSVTRAREALSVGNVKVNAKCQDLEVLADPLFDKVFYNLIDNAMKYGGDRMTRIDIFYHESDKGLTIIFEDDGMGIDPKEKPCLFKQGCGKHTGLGLFLIKEILSITGITIDETGYEGKGTRFEIFVPPDAFRTIGRT